MQYQNRPTAIKCRRVGAWQRLRSTLELGQFLRRYTEAVKKAPWRGHTPRGPRCRHRVELLDCRRVSGYDELVQILPTLDPWPDTDRPVVICAVSGLAGTRVAGHSHARPGTSQDVFLHISSMERAGIRSLNDGQAVTFDVERGRDGRESAINLALA